ncbi:MAG TPA: bifunctional phosphoribosyl-AMP cyclohydrolase/phosphoribosyl-ATP diphosphatase HisIE [Kofleriaceae bacterium]|nr:bifunctional phosphoribosyl-AMP cyclohydrolase/phosphoribosyl-ATP diphosphatase HisIE [Kofleriaceae bacterium]
MQVEPKYDERGLVPCVVQDATTGVVLMLAWMNADALRATRQTGEVHFWSRSRQALWKKGETSGNVLAVVELRIDCDLDTVLIRARPAGPTCHTGATSCFFHRAVEPRQAAGGTDAETDQAASTAAAAVTGQAAGVPTDRAADATRVAIDVDTDDGPAAPILHRLARTIDQRRDATAEKSYTKSLLDAGMPKILAKIAEEHGELAAELPAGDDAKVIHETADLLFHVMVGLGARRLPIEAVLAELERRFGTSGHVEKARRT